LSIDDLRFQSGETEQFLQAMTDHMLAVEDVRLLQERTEGWIAGLQLSALSLHGKQDISAFVREFAGSNRFVLDYLSDEVLSQLPAPTLTFLLHTCVLERLDAPLCTTPSLSRTSLVSPGSFRELCGRCSRGVNLMSCSAGSIACPPRWNTLSQHFASITPQH
jgi:hypothetical protein